MEWNGVVLRGAQLRELKGRSQLVEPSVRVGKAGITPELMAQVQRAFAHTDLIKVKFDDHKDRKKELTRQIATEGGYVPILQVGHTATFFKPALDSTATPPPGEPRDSA